MERQFLGVKQELSFKYFSGDRNKYEGCGAGGGHEVEKKTYTEIFEWETLNCKENLESYVYLTVHHCDS